VTGSPTTSTSSPLAPRLSQSWIDLWTHDPADASHGARNGSCPELRRDHLTRPDNSAEVSQVRAFRSAVGCLQATTKCAQAVAHAS
jgi:hypothetical protein